MSDLPKTPTQKSPKSLVMNSIDTPESELTQMSRCCVCYETYNDGTRAPIAIPCGHTFCKACVDTVMLDLLFCCCSCRTVSIASTEGFRKNLTLIQLLSHLNLLATDNRPPRDLPIRDEDAEYDKIYDNFDVDDALRNIRFQHLLLHNFICHYLPRAPNDNERRRMEQAIDSLENCFKPIEMAMLAIDKILRPEWYEAWINGGAFADSSDEESDRGVAPPLSASSSSSSYSAPMLTPEDEEHFRELLLESGEPTSEMYENLAMNSGNVAHLVPADDVEDDELVGPEVVDVEDDERVGPEIVDVEDDELVGPELVDVEDEEAAEPEVAGGEDDELVGHEVVDVEAVAVENDEVIDDYEASLIVETETWKTQFAHHMETNWHFYLFVFIILYAHLSCYLYGWYYL